MFDGAKNMIAETARKTALGLLGAVFLVVGLGFLTAAAYIALAAVRDVQFACLVIGLAYVGLALVLFAVAGARRRPQRPNRPPAPSSYDEAHPMASVIAAFLEGMAAGAGRGRKS